MTSALQDCDSTATKPREGGRLRAIGAGLLLAAALLPAAGAGAQPTVATTSGTFTGVPSPSAAAVDVFFGIRYAASPAGAARWTPPQLPTSLPGTTVADVPGPACPQPGGIAPQSEDCLFLNIYVPASANKHSRLPVFFWIHGGALVTGTGAIYDPSVMVAENNIVVVTINYRLGAAGWSSRRSRPKCRASSKMSATPAITASWTSNLPCNGCARTSPVSAATRTG